MLQFHAKVAKNVIELVELLSWIIRMLRFHVKVAKDAIRMLQFQYNFQIDPKLVSFMIYMKYKVRIVKKGYLVR